MEGAEYYKPIIFFEWKENTSAVESLKIFSNRIKGVEKLFIWSKIIEKY